MGRRNTLFIEYEGRKWPVRELAQHLGLTPRYLSYRVFKLGMQVHSDWKVEPSPSSALPAIEPAPAPFVEVCAERGTGYTSETRINYRGQSVALRDLAHVHGIRPSLLYARIFDRGWPIDRALSK